jgi:iron-sulfur cluster repair protein YtfE (RIC family)
MRTDIPHLVSEHRECDELLHRAEQAINEGQLTEALVLLNRFSDMLNRHLQEEEQDWFPAFEKQTGMTSGPTMVMRLSMPISVTWQHRQAVRRCRTNGRGAGCN